MNIRDKYLKTLVFYSDAHRSQQSRVVGVDHTAITKTVVLHG